MIFSETKTNHKVNLTLKLDKIEYEIDCGIYNNNIMNFRSALNNCSCRQCEKCNIFKIYKSLNLKPLQCLRIF